MRRIKNGLIKASLVASILTGIGTACSETLTPVRTAITVAAVCWASLVLVVNWDRLNGLR